MYAINTAIQAPAGSSRYNFDLNQIPGFDIQKMTKQLSEHLKKKVDMLHISV